MTMRVHVTSRRVADGGVMCVHCLRRILFTSFKFSVFLACISRVPKIAASGTQCKMISVYFFPRVDYNVTLSQAVVKTNLHTYLLCFPRDYYVAESHLSM